MESLRPRRRGWTALPTSLRLGSSALGFVALGFVALGFSTLGCGSGEDNRGDGTGGGGPSGAGGGGPSGTGGTVILPPGGTGGAGNRPVAMIQHTLPDGFTPETNGGWKVIGRLQDFDEPTENVCANVLRVVARDFTQAHVDFGQRKPANWVDPGLYTDLVLHDLGENRKPSIDPGRTPGVIDDFTHWYVTEEGVNSAWVMDMWLQPDPDQPGTFVFDSNSFFPLDEHNDWPGDVQYGGPDNAPHNFLFTTEIHTAFEYKGGEVFNFRGDDDVWVFINGKLAVDLGGIHGPIVGNVNLDTEAAKLGIEPGNRYNLDLFQAERNPTGSNFRIETSLDFRECGILRDDVVR